jgi:flavodoxin I
VYKIKVIYGSDTGNTEHVIDTYLLSELNNYEVELIDVSNVTADTWNNDNFFILGIPTWYDGELQSDWEDYFEEFKKIDFNKKTVAIFGLGDQVGYDEWFCDGIGILAEVVISNGGKIIGYTKKDDSYNFDTTPKVLKDENTFYGLALDEDNQSELTQNRIQKWVKQLFNKDNKDG